MTESQREMQAGNRNPATSTGRADSYLEVWADSRNPVDTTANVRSTHDTIHVAIDLDVRLNGLTHHQRWWLETFKGELL